MRLLKIVQALLVNAMTIIRLGLAYFIPSLLIDEPTMALVAFMVASVLDFDGALARYWNVTTKFGAFMDPVSDKVLIIVVIFGLYNAGGLWSVDSLMWSLLVLIPTIVIVSREVLTMISPFWYLVWDLYNRRIVAMRELFTFGIEAPGARPATTSMSKWKMGTQCAALGVLIWAQTTANTQEPYILFTGYVLWTIGLVSYWLAGYFTLVTGLDYLRKAMPSYERPISTLLARFWVPAPLN